MLCIKLEYTELESMKFQFKWLILWFAFYYFLIQGGLQAYIRTGSTDSISLIDTAFSLTSPLAFFIGMALSYFVLYSFFPTKKWLLIIIGLFLSLCISISFRYLIEQKLFMSLFNISNYPKDVDLAFYLKDNYLFASDYIVAGIILFFVRFTFYNQQREKELTIENQKIELSLLNAQINPHFLLNSLNNIQSLVYMKSEKAINAIEHLSELLKYNLYQDKQWISIDKEMAIVHKYIALEKLRLDYNVNINIDVDPTLPSYEIPQNLIIPIIENAFKHADLKSELHPFELILKKEDKNLVITTSNKIGTHHKDKIGGIGLENLQKRLELLYPQNHTFKITNNSQVFSLDITIPLR